MHVCIRYGRPLKTIVVFCWWAVAGSPFDNVLSIPLRISKEWTHSHPLECFIQFLWQSNKRQVAFPLVTGSFVFSLLETRAISFPYQVKALLSKAKLYFSWRYTALQYFFFFLKLYSVTMVEFNFRAPFNCRGTAPCFYSGSNACHRQLKQCRTYLEVRREAFSTISWFQQQCWHEFLPCPEPFISVSCYGTVLPHLYKHNCLWSHVANWISKLIWVKTNKKTMN